MSKKNEKSDANQSNSWFWVGVSVCLIVAFDKGVDSRKVIQKRKIQEEARLNSQVAADESHVMPFVDLDPIDFELAATSEGAGKPRSERQVVVITDEDGTTTRSSRAGRNEIIRKSGNRSSESDRLSVLTEDIREPEAEKLDARAKALNARSEKIEAHVNAQNAGKMEELEHKLAEAGEKIRAAAERAGAKVAERSRNVIVTRVLGDSSVPPVPPVPPMPPSVPGLSGIDAKKTPEAQKFQVRSGPCATREKSIAEVRTNLDKIVASRLTPYGLNDSDVVRKAVESLRPKFEVEESFREVGGDRYPLYVASVNVDLGTNFERQALRLVNQQTAHQRFAGLMGLSFGVVALLIGIDRMFLGRSGSPDTSGKSLV